MNWFSCEILKYWKVTKYIYSSILPFHASSYFILPQHLWLQVICRKVTVGLYSSLLKWELDFIWCSCLLQQAYRYFQAEHECSVARPAFKPLDRLLLVNDRLRGGASLCSNIWTHLLPPPAAAEQMEYWWGGVNNLTSCGRLVKCPAAVDVIGGEQETLVNYLGEVTHWFYLGEVTYWQNAFPVPHRHLNHHNNISYS